MKAAVIIVDACPCYSVSAGDCIEDVYQLMNSVRAVARVSGFWDPASEPGKQHGKVAH